MEKRQLIIFHNGRPFDEKDIEGVCGIANGTKEDGTRIGHFGIGFKSVYCYTDRPQIYSGEHHFAIKNRLFPEEISPRPGLSASETCMILPFDKEEVTPDTAYQEIRNALIKKITAESILMLNHISDVEIRVTGYEDIMGNGFIALMYVDEVKGIEFDKAYVVVNKMSRNEKYIAYTRALSELILVIDDQVADYDDGSSMEEQNTKTKSPASSQKRKDQKGILNYKADKTEGSDDKEGVINGMQVSSDDSENS